MPKESEPTIRDVLEAIHSFADQTEQRMVTKDYLKDELAPIRSSMVTKDFLEQRLDQRFAQFETRMVTKDYLDDKLADLQGNLVILTRRPDRKVDTLVDVLHEKRVITDADVERVASSSR